MAALTRDVQVRFSLHDDLTTRHRDPVGRDERVEAHVHARHLQVEVVRVVHDGPGLQGQPADTQHS